MTTIAYRDRLLVSESRLTEKNFIYSDTCQKLWKLEDGSLFGSSGSDDGGHMLLAAMQNGDKIPELVGTKALHVKRDGTVWLYEGAIWTPWTDEFVAIGSGKRFAMAAMHAGANAIEAVNIAKKCDVYSGGENQVLVLYK